MPNLGEGGGMGDTRIQMRPFPGPNTGLTSDSHSLALFTAVWRQGTNYKGPAKTCTPPSGKRTGCLPQTAEAHHSGQLQLPTPGCLLGYNKWGCPHACIHVSKHC